MKFYRDIVSSEPLYIKGLEPRHQFCVEFRVIDHMEDLLKNPQVIYELRFSELFNWCRENLNNVHIYGAQVGVGPWQSRINAVVINILNEEEAFAFKMMWC